MLKRIRLLSLVVLAGATAAAAQQQTNLTVSELDNLLAGMRQSSDRSVASRLAGLKLTERVSSAQLGRWEEKIPGNRGREALIALADASAFLRPPLAESPAMAAPDEAMITQMHAQMVDYVKNSLPRLPNFVAERTTTAFVISTEERVAARLRTSQMLQIGGKKQESYHGYHTLGPAKASGLPDGKLIWLGSFSQTVTYRDGAEVADHSAQTAIEAGRLAVGLTTSGEFGSILRLLLMDAAPESIVWNRWEHGATGPLAVFHYSVLREKSHFAVYLGEDDQPDYPAYRGEIVIDPSSGAVSRITVTAETHNPASSNSMAMLVEFGPAQIGGMTYICPIHGVAMTKNFSSFADPAADPPPVTSQTSINDISFTNYHVFRSNSRVLSGPPSP